MNYLYAGHEKAKIELEFYFKSCCSDNTGVFIRSMSRQNSSTHQPLNTGVHVLGTKVYQPITCSQRTCFYEDNLPFPFWIFEKVRFRVSLLVSENFMEGDSWI